MEARSSRVGRPVIYVFTHDSERLTLYYDIELRESLDDKAPNGTMLPTTTIVTKNRLYVPVPGELESTFKISEGYKDFFVRFDTVVQS